MEGRTRRLWAVAVLIGLSIACIGRERVNRDCLWTHDAAFHLDLRDSVHQKHLRYDADLMEDLAIRGPSMCRVSLLPLSSCARLSRGVNIGLRRDVARPDF